MKIVKIDRDTIKPNPEAGRAVTIDRGPKYVYFKMNRNVHYDKLSEMGFVEDEDYFISVENLDTRECDCNLIKVYRDKELLDSKLEGIIIEIRNELEQYHHQPLPSHIFYYERTVIECEYCHNVLEVNEIPEEDDDEGNSWEVCPYCDGENTFEYEYENPKDVIPGYH